MTVGVIGFQVRTIVRGRSALVGVAAFAAATLVVTVLGLGSFRQLGVGAVGPASVALVNVGLLLPTAQAILVAALAVSAEREHGFLGAMVARGAGRGLVAVAMWISVTVATWLAVLTGFGVAALLLAGNVPLEDLPAFGGMVVVALAATAVAAAIGVLVGSVVPSRLHAALLGLAAWFVLAIGLDLLVIGLGVFLRGGEAALAAAVLTNPLEAARIAALLVIDGRGSVLGPVGAFLVERLGLGGTLLLMATVVVGWTAFALLIARRVMHLRDL